VLSDIFIASVLDMVNGILMDIFVMMWLLFKI